MIYSWILFQDFSLKGGFVVGEVGTYENNSFHNFCKSHMSLLFQLRRILAVNSGVPTATFSGSKPTLSKNLPVVCLQTKTTLKDTKFRNSLKPSILLMHENPEPVQTLQFLGYSWYSQHTVSNCFLLLFGIRKKHITTCNVRFMGVAF